MITRCYNKKSKHYKSYGGRLKSIVVCIKWKRSFSDFAWWAIHNGYSDELTIDRINNNKGYSPRNCRWVSLEDQQKNRTNNSFHTINGERKTLSEFAKKFNIPKETLRMRLSRGWTGDKLIAGHKSLSGYKNIHVSRRCGKTRYRVRFEVNNEVFDLGRFDDLSEAVSVRDKFLNAKKE